jgi:bis(5'-nucleosyl)-tetraphosphatase (symmetrical)
MVMRTVVVGDVHGCLEELDELLRICEVRPADRLVFLGDLVDRGPDPIGVVRRVRGLRAECILGNHEEKAERWRRREEQARETGKANPMQAPAPERRAQWLALSADDLAWIRALPVVLDLGAGWLAVHGGFEDKPMGKQKDDRVLRCRYLDATGETVPLRDDLGQPPGSVFWTERWRGPDSVVYGHNVDNLENPKLDAPAPGVECVGLDTGCVFGGHLSAMMLFPDGTRAFAQVKAKRVYAVRVVSEAA